MEGMPIRIACLGRIGGSDVASSVTEEAIRIGAEVDFIIESEEYDEFDQGLIDWRKILGNKHWLILSSDGPLFGDSMKSAWGSSLTFAELEGCKSAMIVGVPSEADRLEEAWGSVIDRIRQLTCYSSAMKHWKRFQKSKRSLRTSSWARLEIGGQFLSYAPSIRSRESQK